MAHTCDMKEDIFSHIEDSRSECEKNIIYIYIIYLT